MPVVAGLKAGKELIWPAVIIIGGAASAIGDGISNYGERAGGFWKPSFDGTQVVPKLGETCCQGTTFRYLEN